MRSFVVITRLGSVSRTAEDLRIAQPALSWQVQKLEDELGQALLIRHGARLQLTLEVDSVPLTKAMVQGGVGCITLTYAGVAPELASGALAMRAIQRPPLISTVVLGAISERNPDWLVRGLSNVVAEVVAELVRTGA